MGQANRRAIKTKESGGYLQSDRKDYRFYKEKKNCNVVEKLKRLDPSRITKQIFDTFDRSSKTNLKWFQEKTMQTMNINYADNTVTYRTLLGCYSQFDGFQEKVNAKEELVTRKEGGYQLKISPVLASNEDESLRGPE